MDRFNREKAQAAAKSARIENEWRAKQEEAERNQPSERDRLTAGIRATEITARDAEKRAADGLSIELESAARLLARRHLPAADVGALFRETDAEQAARERWQVVL